MTAVLGSRDPSRKEDDPVSAASTSITAMIRQNAFLVLLAGGVLGSFTIFGYAQEALTRGEYDGERLKLPIFLICVQSFCNCLVAAVLLIATGEKKWSAGAGMQDWSIVSGAYLGAHFFGLSALQYIPFPLQVVCKSCKAVPVMLGEKVLARKKHSPEKMMQVYLMSAGVVAFTLAGGSKKGKSDFELTPTLFLGLGFVLAALVCDGIYGPFQNRIVAQHNASPYQLMFNMNLYELFFAVVLATVTGELPKGIAFVVAHPSVLPNLGYFGTTMAIGSLFVYTLQKNFGALTVTLTTTLRKLISVVFSVLWFGHSLAPAQWLATVVVFLASPIASRLVPLLGWEDSRNEKKAVL
ncbi:unnamed protein product [Amoebophrya sp. A25]|nr:unnamed protein product [Amoebophrya sp. A25]|eukprot:GSA25T00022748001.1